MRGRENGCASGALDVEFDLGDVFRLVARGDVVVDAELVRVGHDLQGVVCAVLQQLLIRPADGRVVPDVAEAGARSRRKAADVGGAVGLLDRKKGHRRLRVAPGQDVRQRNDDPGLKEDRQLLLEGVRKALLGRDADLLERIGRGTSRQRMCRAPTSSTRTGLSARQ